MDTIENKKIINNTDETIKNCINIIPVDEYENENKKEKNDNEDIRKKIKTILCSAAAATYSTFPSSSTSILSPTKNSSSINIIPINSHINDFNLSSSNNLINNSSVIPPTAPLNSMSATKKNKFSNNIPNTSTINSHNSLFSPSLIQSHTNDSLYNTNIVNNSISPISTTVSSTSSSISIPSSTTSISLANQSVPISGSSTITTHPINPPYKLKLNWTTKYCGGKKVHGLSKLCSRTFVHNHSIEENFTGVEKKIDSINSTIEIQSTNGEVNSSSLNCPYLSYVCQCKHTRKRYNYELHYKFLRAVYKKKMHLIRSGELWMSFGDCLFSSKNSILKDEKNTFKKEEKEKNINESEVIMNKAETEIENESIKSKVKSYEYDENELSVLFCSPESLIEENKIKKKRKYNKKFSNENETSEISIKSEPKDLDSVNTNSKKLDTSYQLDCLNSSCSVCQYCSIYEDEYNYNDLDEDENDGIEGIFHQYKNVEGKTLRERFCQVIESEKKKIFNIKNNSSILNEKKKDPENELILTPYQILINKILSEMEENNPNTSENSVSH